MSVLRDMLDRMREYFADKPPQNWWPDDPLEVIVGAVLVPGSTWKVVARVLEEFKRDEMMDIGKILSLSPDELEARVRPTGFPPKKARALRELLQHIRNIADDNLTVFFSRDPELLRKELLSLYRIGEATADNILLYAGNLPSYSIDLFTRRLAIRHGLVPPKAKDAEFRKLVEEQLAKDDPELFYDFQALLVRLGREYCGKSIPLCSYCPLNIFLPEGGAIGESPLIMRKTPPKSAQPEPSLQTVKDSGQLLVDSRPSRSKPECPPQPLAQPLPDLSAMSEKERQVFGLIGLDPTPIDSVIAGGNLKTHEILAILGGMELRRYIVRGEGNTVRRNR